MDAKLGDGHARWDDLRLLLTVSRRGSFLAAGRELSLATSTLSRRLTRLESDVGAVLLERRADGVRLTEAGRHLVETAEAVELQLHARLRDLPPEAGAHAGVIRVTMGDGFTEFVTGTIARFAALHPGVSFEVESESRAADLTRREADVAIRTLHQRESSLVYQTLGSLPYGLFAARDYGERSGRPRALGDLAKHRFVGFTAPLDRAPVMRWLRAHGAHRFVVRATSFAPVLAATHAGVGIAPLPVALGDGLERILPRARPDPLPVYLASHPDARRLPHVRAFLELLARSFRDGLVALDRGTAPRGHSAR